MSPTRTLPHRESNLQRTSESTDSAAVKKKHRRKRLWILLTVFGVVILLPVFFLLGIVAGINPIFRWQVQRLGSKALHVPVHVGRASVSFAGRANVKALSVANPSGYQDTNAFTAELLYAQAPLRSIFDEKIDIPELVIVSPQFWYDLNRIGEKSNWGALMKNLGKSHPLKGERRPEDHEKKFVIHRLRIVGPVVHFGGPSIPKGITLHLKDIELRDVGTAPGSASKTYVVFATIFQAILTGTLREGKSLPANVRGPLALELAEAAKTFADILQSVK